MTQFDQGSSYGGFDPTAGPSGDQPRTSGIAIASLVCSLILCCPLTTVIGALLGLIGVIVTATNPMRKGTVLAALGLIIGVAGTGAWFYGGYAANRWFKTAPQSAFEAGYDSGVDAFQERIHAPGAHDDAAARAFLDELRSRYGAFESAEFSADQDWQPPQTGSQQPFMPDVPYVLRFENAEVRAEIDLVFADEQSGDLVFMIGAIEVIDDELGNLVYPPPTADEPAEDDGSTDDGSTEGAGEGEGEGPGDGGEPAGEPAGGPGTGGDG